MGKKKQVLVEGRVRTFEMSAGRYRTTELRLDRAIFLRVFQSPKSDDPGKVDTRKLHKWLASHGIRPEEGYVTSTEHGSNDVIFSQTKWILDDAEGPSDSRPRVG